MSEHVTRLMVGSRPMTFVGNREDPYFSNLAAFQAHNHQLERMALRLPKNATCLDVGSNIGLTALTLAEAVPGGRVYAFEPSAWNAKYLRENISRNGVSNITFTEAAVGDKAGTVSFHLTTLGANSTVLRASPEAAHNVSRIPLITLDSWAAGNSIQRIDFIKIDVEGYERQVLIGAADTLVSRRPTVLMEFNSVTIASEDRLSPFVFAEALGKVFEISTVLEDGSLSPAGSGDLRRFVLDNMTAHGCVDDVVLRPRPDVTAQQIRSALLMVG
jgi:FkbM family methyltransferase